MHAIRIDGTGQQWCNVTATAQTSWITLMSLIGNNRRCLLQWRIKQRWSVQWPSYHKDHVIATVSVQFTSTPIARVVLKLPTNFNISRTIHSRLWAARVRPCNLVTLTFDLGGHGGAWWGGALCSICVLSLNFVGLTIRKISRILCVRITPSVTLTFHILTLKLVRNIALVLGNLPINFGVSTAHPAATYLPLNTESTMYRLAQKSKPQNSWQ